MNESGRIARLSATLGTRFENVVPHPVEVVGSYPFVVIYPSAPFVQAGTVCDREISVQVIVYLSRLNSIESLDAALDTIDPVASAANEADAAWQSMTYQPIPVGGADHLAAVHEVTVYT